MIKHIISFCFVALFLSSCNNSTSSVEPELGQKFNIEYGQTVTLSDKGATIHFTQLLNDSRCPKGAMCVWAGNAKIEILINKTPIKLNTNSGFQTETIVSDYKIKLISLSPYPDLNNPSTKEDYWASLLVTEAE